AGPSRSRRGRRAPRSCAGRASRRRSRPPRPRRPRRSTRPPPAPWRRRRSTAGARRSEAPRAHRTPVRLPALPLEQHEQDWTELDPYWAILTTSGKRFGRWDSDEFFATGPPEVEGLMNRAAQLGHPQQYRRALDFGCGLGRVTRALADRFEECVGVDISENMV